MRCIRSKIISPRKQFARIDALYLQQFAMHCQHILTAGTLVQVVDVLRDQQEITFVMTFELRKRKVSGTFTFFGEALESCRTWVERDFKSDLVKGLIAPWVLHAGLGPDDAYSGLMGKVIMGAVGMAGMPIASAAWQLAMLSSINRQASTARFRLWAAPRYAADAGLRTPVRQETNVQFRYCESLSLASIVRYQMG